MVKNYEVSEQRLSENFRVREFACKCGKCTQVQIDDVLVAQLQAIRNHFGASVHINSGYRCASHNAAVGGHKQSGHLQGMAADIVVRGVKPREVAKFAESMGIVRIGLYDSFVHIGSGNAKRFWLGHQGTGVDTHGGTATFDLTLPVLRRGSRGETVKTLQSLLRGKAYDLALDGSFGPATEAAVKDYQAANKLPAHGIADEVTQRKLLGIK